MADTIFALSSGSPPAGIGVIRISGPQASVALRDIAGRVPEPRRASLAQLRDPVGHLLDQAMILWLPGPGTVTGEDIAEIHCHGGRAVVAAIETALAGLPKLRRATPGEFTRRAFANGRIDLAEAEGLADLLSAETELQRRSAIAMAGGAFSRSVEAWRERLLQLSAAVEAELDFSDEADVPETGSRIQQGIAELGKEIGESLAKPSAEVLKDGFRVVIAGPPNAGKSTLFNALVESEAAITSQYAGTTRDVITRAVAIEAVPFLFVDTAGLRDETSDPIEKIGISRAEDELKAADLVLWLGVEGAGPPGAWEIEAQADKPDQVVKQQPRHRLSAVTGAGMDALRRDLLEQASAALPKPGEAALNRRQRELLFGAMSAMVDAQGAASGDLLVLAENLRLARIAFDRLIGRSATEDVLDTLFGRFCIGK